MGVYEWMVLGSIFCLVLVSLMHSFFGERLLIGPLLKYRGNKSLEHPLMRMILRFAWHITSITWLLLAYILYVLAFAGDPHEAAILSGVGFSFLAIGLFDLIVSKGRHLGWPVLTLIGIFALLARFYLHTE